MQDSRRAACWALQDDWMYRGSAHEQQDMPAARLEDNGTQVCAVLLRHNVPQASQEQRSSARQSAGCRCWWQVCQTAAKPYVDLR